METKETKTEVKTEAKEVKIVVTGILEELRRKKGAIVAVNTPDGNIDLVKVEKIFSDTRETVLMVKNIKDGRIGFLPKMSPDFYLSWIEKNEIDRTVPKEKWEDYINQTITGMESVDRFL